MTNTARVRHTIVRDVPREDNFPTKLDFLPNGQQLRKKMELKVGTENPEARLGRPWSGEPWLTPILGSGPLGLPSSFLAVAGSLHQAIVVKLKGHEVLRNHEGIGADHLIWLDRFAEMMVSQRVGDDRAEFRAVVASGDSGESDLVNATMSELADRVSDLAALMVLVSAQLTRTFHRISLDTCRPVSRWGSESSTMRHDHDRRQPLVDEYVDLLRDACDAATQAIGVEGGSSTTLASHLKPIQDLLSDVRTRATSSSPTVALLHLQQVTEIAWFLLVLSIVGDAYPGWTDLLLRLVLTDSQGVSHGHTRPRWAEIKQVAPEIRSIIEPASKAAWTKANKDRDRIENRDFYNSVARSLWSQEEARLAWGKSPRGAASGLPQPTGFVASFDYELEMALWRTARSFGRGKSFSVVIPAYAVESEDSNDAEFVWLEGIVRVPDADVTTEVEPAASEFDQMRKLTDWRLISSERLEWHDHPVVVRITGCPLVNLPDLSESSKEHDLLRRDLSEAGIAWASMFIHSVTIDEYLALRQMEAEWLWSGSDSNDAPPSRGLPVQYLEARANAPRRYWMIMGVPFRDPAVRLRIMAILSKASGTKSSREPAPDSPDAATDDAPQTLPEPELPKSDGIGSKPRFGANAAHVNGRSATTAPSGPTSTEPRSDDSRSRGRAEPPDLGATRYHGVAVNTRMDDDEAMLLNALGFEVVTDRCESFTAEISSYADWLGSRTRDLAKLAQGERR